MSHTLVSWEQLLSDYRTWKWQHTGDKYIEEFLPLDFPQLWDAGGVTVSLNDWRRNPNGLCREIRRAIRMGQSRLEHFSPSSTARDLISLDVISSRKNREPLRKKDDSDEDSDWGDDDESEEDEISLIIPGRVNFVS